MTVRVKGASPEAPRCFWSKHGDYGWCVAVPEDNVPRKRNGIRGPVRVHAKSGEVREAYLLDRVGSIPFQGVMYVRFTEDRDPFDTLGDGVADGDADADVFSDYCGLNYGGGPDWGDREY
jgi:hypothetical protein